MKTALFVFFAALGAFISVSAHACPNLAGTYLCPADSINPDVTLITVVQRQVNGVWSYNMQEKNQKTGTVNSYEGTADGVQRPVTEGDRVLEETFSCEADAALRLDVQTKDPVVGATTGRVIFNLDPQSNLDEAFDTVTSFGPYNMQRHCTRQ